MNGKHRGAPSAEEMRARRAETRLRVDRLRHPLMGLSITADQAAEIVAGFELEHARHAFQLDRAAAALIAETVWYVGKSSSEGGDHAQ